MRRRILVIEDDPDVRDMVIMALEEERYEVLGAQHGREALQMLLQPNGYGVLLLDMRMPVMDGWQFMAALRCNPQLTRYQIVPIIVLTAAADAARWAAQIGANGYLAKPFTIQGIKDVVAAFLHPPAP